MVIYIPKEKKRTISQNWVKAYNTKYKTDIWVSKSNRLKKKLMLKIIEKT